MTRAPQTLLDRYGPDDAKLFDEQERRRFLDGNDDPGGVAWNLLYRKEPELYERLIAGEHIHPRVLSSLPAARTVVEVAAGTGRLTTYLSSRYDHIIAVEPAGALRRVLEGKALPGVEVTSGFFDSLPVAHASADLVVSCSALTSEPMHGGDDGLREMERVLAPGGTIAVVWPADVKWLTGHGFNYASFDGDMHVDFGTIGEAVELARIFYPDAVDEITSRGNARVPYDLLGVNAPRDLAWRRGS